MNGIRETLTQLREQAGISQAELAKRLTNASASRISRIESGDLGVTTEDAEQIADALGATLPAAKEFADTYVKTGALSTDRRSTTLVAPRFGRLNWPCSNSPIWKRTRKSGMPSSSRSSPANRRSNVSWRSFYRPSTRSPSSVDQGLAKRPPFALSRNFVAS